MVSYLAGWLVENFKTQPPKIKRLSKANYLQYSLISTKVKYQIGKNTLGCFGFWQVQVRTQMCNTLTSQLKRVMKPYINSIYYLKRVLIGPLSSTAQANSESRPNGVGMQIH